MRTPFTGRPARRLVALAALPLSATLLAGCSWQSLGMSDTSAPSASQKPVSAHHSAPRAATASEPATSSVGKHTATVRYVRGGLAAGSATHRLSIGDRSIVISYWTTRDAATWTSGDAAPIHVSAQVKGSAHKTKVFVTGFRATFTPATGAPRQLITDAGRFVVSAPYSYGTAAVIPPVSATTDSAHLEIQFDLLIETTPGSGDYYRQTVLDTVPFTYTTDSLREKS